ncbi:hypothetical protein [Streptomyces coeruleorubidus]|uniref:hypothetical protein n=1 Tax=Streptomyces coeruleorubidus TaxID=116188 RepID=UPI0033B9183C
MTNRPNPNTPEAPQEATEGRLSAPEAPSGQRETPRGRNGPQRGAQGFEGEQQPRGPVDWARHYADKREERAAGDPAWDTLRARAFNAVQPALRQVGEWLPLSARRAVADAVLAELKRELDAFAEYENTISWMTTCTSCARVLDSCIRETERADRAESAVAHVRSLHRENCPVAQRVVKPTAFTCGMCDALGDPSPAHNAGPSVAEAAADDRRWWNGEKAGER